MPSGQKNESSAFPRQQSRRNRLRCGIGRCLVDLDITHQIADRKLGVFLQRDVSRQRLQYRIIDPMVAVGSGRTETGDLAMNQIGTLRPQIGFSQTQSLSRPRPPMRDKYVGASDQIACDLDTFGLLHVEDDRSLAAIAVQIQGRHPVSFVDRLTAQVADARWFDLDDVSTLVGERHRRKRSRHNARDINDAVARKRSLRKIRFRHAPTLLPCSRN
jgi:hypothetical protein